MVTPAGFEPAIFWMRTRYPGPLDEGAGTQQANCDQISLSHLLADVYQARKRKQIGRLFGKLKNKHYGSSKFIA